MCMLVDALNTDHLLGVLRVVKLCYEYSFLRGRRSVGLRLSRLDELRLSSLQRLLEEDSAEKRRRHRRVPVMLTVELRAEDGLRRATILNLSADGMFVATPTPVAAGSEVQIRIGRRTDVEYSFPCVVQWTISGANPGMGLRIIGIPLEVRHGAARAA
jgi:hypothetical protein